MKTTSQRVWGMLRSRKVGSQFSSKMLYGNLPNSTKKAILSALNRMHKAGAIKNTDSKGVYEVTDKMANWGNTVRFQTRKSGVPVKKPIRSTTKNRVVKYLHNLEQAEGKAQKSSDETDSPILGLLKAIRRAEPELLRLLEQDRKLREMTK